MIAGMFASCSLDSMSLTEKDTTNFPKTAEDANQALAAIYQNLNNVNAFPQQSFLYNSLLACDDMLGGGGPNNKLMQSLDLICNTGTKCYAGLLGGSLSRNQPCQYVVGGSCWY